MATAVTPAQQPDSARLEQALLALAPALEEQRVAGLLLRSARGVLPSANSAVPGLMPARSDPETQRRAAEHFFATVQQPTQWLIGQRPANRDLETHLLGSGYARTQTRVIWYRDCRRQDARAPQASLTAVRRENDPARFARSYGRLADQPEPAIRLQALRLQALAQRGPLALLTAGQADAAIEGCLIAVVDAIPPQKDLAVGGIGRIGLLSDLLVAHQARRSGLASRLVAAAEHWFGQQGCDWIALETADDNPIAHNFYRQRGFEIAGQWSFFRTPSGLKTVRMAMT